MWRWQSGRGVILGLASVLFVVCCLLPVAYLAAVSLSDAGTLARLALDDRQSRLLLNTCLLGAGTACLATAIGAPIGIALARISLPGRNLLRFALAAPLTLPPYIVGLAWTYAGSRDRWLEQWIHSLPGAIVILSLVFYPIAMLATEVVMRRIDGRLEEAALLAVPPGQVLRRITLPLAAPGIVAASLIIFVMAVSEFGVPGLLRVRVYTTEVFTAFAALYDFGRAIVVAAPLLLLCVAVAAVAATVMGERLVVTRRSGGTRPMLFDQWRQTAAIAAGAVVLIALAFPLVVLTREALGADSLPATVAGSGTAVANSLWLAAAGATAVVMLGLCLGYARARAARFGRLADVVFIVVFAVPSTIVGVGLIGLWNRSGPLGVLYGTDTMLLLGYVARFAPVAALAIAAATRYLPVAQEEAAALSGAAWPRTMWRIVLPQIRLAVAATWVIAFILVFGELGVSILVAPPGEATLPIRIYTIVANTPSSHVAALALLQASVIFTPLAALAIAVSFGRQR